MKIGRNQPCPCGSGKKYKTCCLPLDRKRDVVGRLTAPARLVARGAELWQADYVPLPILVEEAPAARSAARLIVAGGEPISAELLDAPPFETAEAASDLAAAIIALAKELGSGPREIALRRPVLGEALHEALAGHGIGVSVHDRLDALETAEAEMLEHFGGERRAEPLPVLSWQAWRQGEAWTAALFSAAAAFYRAAPWQGLEASHVFALETGSGTAWSAYVLGQEDRAYGLTLAKEPEPSHDTFEDHAPFLDETISLIFYEAQELPRAMRKEVLRAGWEVASPEAYPNLFTAGTLGGGFTREDASDLVDVLGAIPRFLAAERPDADAAWTDPETDLAILLVDSDGPGAVSLLEDLAPGDVRGTGAEPSARFDFWRDDEPASIDEAMDAEMAVLEDYRQHLAATLKPATVQRHTENARLLIEYLVGYGGIPLRAIHEYDLRQFLYDFVPRKVIAPHSETRALPGSLARFFRFLVTERDLVCPWAQEILDDRETFFEASGIAPSDPAGDVFDAELELIVRLLSPDHRLGEDGDEWGVIMGLTEARLLQQLQRLWLGWRDGALRAHHGDIEAVVSQLAERKRAWESAPQAELQGRTPLEAIHAERAEMAARRR